MKKSSGLVRRVAPVLCAALLLPLAAQAQNCRKGIPCGRTCIAANRTCRIGASSDPTPAPPAAVSPAERVTVRGFVAPSAPTVGADALWVGSLADSVYFRASCSAAQDLAPRNRVPFVSEDEARRQGFRRSRVVDC